MGVSQISSLTKFESQSNYQAKRCLNFPQDSAATAQSWRRLREGLKLPDFQTGASPLHTAWYINEKGDKIWLKFDSSIPCNMFPTYETRFYKPKLHKIERDPYAEKKVDENF